MKKTGEILVVIAFTVVLILPMCESIFHFLPEVENNENRALKAIPKFDINLLDDFPTDFDNYYTDNFDLRNILLKLNSNLKFRIFNVPPIKGKAFIGNEGWMYLVKDEMDIYLGNNLASDGELNRYYDIFKYREKFLDSIGSRYYVVIAPIKTSVYPEFIPISKSKKDQITLTDQIVTLLDTVSGITIIDLRHALISAKGNTRLFHKTDNHWNEYGSFIGYREIMQVLKKDFPQLALNELNDFIVDSTADKGMSLTNMMGIYDGVSEQVITCKQTTTKLSYEGKKSNYPIPYKFPYASSFEVVYNVDNDSLPKLLMIRDSFGKTVIPYLSEHFGKSTYIFDGWLHRLNEEIVLNEKPDIYIQLMVESFLPNLHDHAKKP